MTEGLVNGTFGFSSCNWCTAQMMRETETLTWFNVTFSREGRNPAVDLPLVFWIIWIVDHDHSMSIFKDHGPALFIFSVTGDIPQFDQNFIESGSFWISRTFFFEFDDSDCNRWLIGLWSCVAATRNEVSNSSFPRLGWSNNQNFYWIRRHFPEVSNLLIQLPNFRISNNPIE